MILCESKRWILVMHSLARLHLVVLRLVFGSLIRLLSVCSGG